LRRGAGVAGRYEKWALQNELFKVQKRESLGLLAGGIAHDVNNILTAIQANISLAKCLIPSDNRFAAKKTTTPASHPDHSKDSRFNRRSRSSSLVVGMTLRVLSQ